MGIFFKFTEGSPQLFRTNGFRPFILNCLGKRKKRLRVGEKRVSRLNI
jgi:hypothetical protein